MCDALERLFRVRGMACPARCAELLVKERGAGSLDCVRRWAGALLGLDETTF